MNNTTAATRQGIAMSIVIITHNEERIISQCVEHAKLLSDDIVVVDAESTDKTASLAQQAGARVFVRTWEGYSSQKNFGNLQALHNMIFSIDADEIITPELVTQIRKTLRKYPAQKLFSVTMINNFEGKFIYHGGWYPRWYKRIFDRRIMEWNDSKVHEGLRGTEPLTAMKIKGRLLHFTAPSLEWHAEKLRRYALLFAKDKFEKRIRFGLLKKYLSSGFRFLHEYLVRMGFLDGRVGFIIAWKNAEYSFLKYYYLEQLYKFSTITQNQPLID